MKFLNGYKSIISSVVLLIVNSDYVASLITDPSLYILLQAVVVAIFASSVLHHVQKDLKKNISENS